MERAQYNSKAIERAVMWLLHYSRKELMMTSFELWQRHGENYTDLQLILKVELIESNRLNKNLIEV